MRAMILAAGLGTRLRPLTNDRPKALVEVDGRTLLEITLMRLRSFGIDNVIINVHHFADRMIEYLHEKKNFGLHIAVSREDELLDTGGGLKKASYFFEKSDETFILHNVDVISTIDFNRMIQRHGQTNALATLAVQDRKTSRYLLFDEQLQLCGRRAGNDGEPELARACDSFKPLAFAGIHVISPRIFRLMTEAGAFSIVNTYLRLAADGEIISGFPADQYYWRDLGKPENVREAGLDLERGAVKF